MFLHCFEFVYSVCTPIIQHSAQVPERSTLRDRRDRRKAIIVPSLKEIAAITKKTTATITMKSGISSLGVIHTLWTFFEHNVQHSPLIGNQQVLHSSPWAQENGERVQRSDLSPSAVTYCIYFPDLSSFWIERLLSWCHIE